MLAGSRKVCEGWASAPVGAYRTIILKSHLNGITQTAYDISVYQAFIRGENEIPDPSRCEIGKALLINEIIIGEILNYLLRNVKARHEILLLLALFVEGYLLRIS